MAGSKREADPPDAVSPDSRHGLGVRRAEWEMGKSAVEAVECLERF